MKWTYGVLGMFIAIWHPSYWWPVLLVVLLLDFEDERGRGK